MISQSSACSLLLAALCLSAAPLRGSGQEAQSVASPDVPFVLKVTSREVVIDVVARDKHNDPVSDLVQGDFEVIELGRHKEKTPRAIRSLRVVDPRHDASRAGSVDSGFRISSGAICALNATTHYELAIAASAEPGFHEVVVKTSRPHVSLSFRRHYYVGPTVDDAHPPAGKAQTDGIALGEAACFHPLTPPTLALTAHPLPSTGARSARYLVIVRPESLPGIGLGGSNTRLQLDFGMCTFDATGAIVQYLHSSADRQLSAVDLQRAQNRGLSNLLEIPSDPPHLARFVVRDRQTGNLGTVDVALPVSLSAQAGDKAAAHRHQGSVRSFGVVTPLDSAFCGDVYELSTGASTLPDFWNLDPVGSLYTDMLNVENQDITMTEGIPGVTRNNTWFAIDYYGAFYITRPGEYQFELESDDGSKLEIDGQPLVDLDGVHQSMAKTAKVNLDVGPHAIHVPYFQGPPMSLALLLKVKPPGGSMRPFKLTEYGPPSFAN